MKNTIILISLFLFSGSSYTQVGIGTTNPQGALDVVSTNSGLVVPRVTSLEHVYDTQGNLPQNGTIVYDELRKKTCHYIDDQWACIGIVSGNVVTTVETVVPIEPIVYVKASNTGFSDLFSKITMSADGNYLAVGAPGENSNATGINGDQSNNSANDSGAVYVFFKSGNTWTQQAYIKASNTDSGDSFGDAVSISSDGSRLVIGSSDEDSAFPGINGNQTNNSATNAGAAYVFLRTGNTWMQEAYIKSSNIGTQDDFGRSVSLSSDGSRLAISSRGEDSSATGINGNQADNTVSSAGAVYIFFRSGTTWTQEAYVKASNTEANDYFGLSISLSGDGSRLAVGAPGEDSNASAINGNQADNSASGAGAVFIFSRSGTVWTQESYIKASNAETFDGFGAEDCVSLNSDGSQLVVGSPSEDSNATGINGNQTDNSASNSGAVYTFSRSGTTWTQEAYIKASNTDANDGFSTVAISGDGTTLIIGAGNEDSNATGTNGDELDNSLSSSGAAYLFEFSGGLWSQLKYVKSPNPDSFDRIKLIAINNDGSYYACSSAGEDSNATGINGDQTNNSTTTSGAVYIYEN